MKKESFWSKDINFKKINKLNKNIEVDVIVIGGGLAGISTAYYLKDSGLNICVVEQGFVGMGVTSKTTGKINYLQETIYSDLEEKYSFDVAKKYFNSQKLAIKEIIDIISKENIDCNLEKVNSYVFTNKYSEVENIKLEKNILEEFGVEVKEYNNLDNEVKGKYGISVSDTYVYHPLKYLYKLKDIIIKSGINIFEQTRIKEIKRNKDGYSCYTSNYKIQAKKVILTCHYPFFLKPYMMPLKVYTEKSYIVVGKSSEYKNNSFITSDSPVKSIRYHKDDDNYIFYLRNSHNICNDLNEVKNFKDVIKEFESLNYKVEYMWSNDDMMSVDRIPYIGRIEKDNDNLLIGTAFSTWGMTNGVLTGYILSKQVLGIKTDYEDIFNPLRASMLVNIGDCFINIGSNLKSIIENKINRRKEWYNEKIKYETRNGKKVAIYNDGEKEYVVLSNCPHLGCTLLFNEVEKTWDCPCHASRFDLNGKCIKGPSVYDISYKEES